MVGTQQGRSRGGGAPHLIVEGDGDGRHHEWPSERRVDVDARRHAKERARGGGGVREQRGGDDGRAEAARVVVTVAEVDALDAHLRVAGGGAVARHEDGDGGRGVVRDVDVRVVVDGQRAEGDDGVGVVRVLLGAGGGRHELLTVQSHLQLVLDRALDQPRAPNEQVVHPVEVGPARRTGTQRELPAALRVVAGDLNMLRARAPSEVVVALAAAPRAPAVK